MVIIRPTVLLIVRLIVRLIVQKETSARNVSTGQSGPDGQNEVIDPIDLTDPIDPIGTTEAIEPSVPSTARRRDTSPSSCRESPYPSINGWRRPDLQCRVRARLRVLVPDRTRTKARRFRTQ